MERIIVRAKKIVYKPPEFNHDFALLRSLLVAVLRHIRAVYENEPIREAEDYQKREKGEVDTQKYPNFPILRERAKYKRDCIMQDKIQRKQACQKEFPSHSKLTPGLYLLTCGCTQKTIYGFSMMLSGESPAMLFDLVMTRFEDNYNPHIIYDASCIAKEFGYNRELRRFMQLSITSDRFHEVNHKSCSNSFKTSEYNQLEKINSEACEQTNSSLRRVTSSTTFMSPAMYMRSLTLFLADMKKVQTNLRKSISKSFVKRGKKIRYHIVLDSPPNLVMNPVF